MVIETEKLTKYYGTKLGCKDISITVDRGQIFAFLGPNGAGKSTFIKILVGLLFPTSGKAYILGKPVGDVSARKRVGYLPENFKYQDWMTGADLLSFHASLYRLDRSKASRRMEEVLELVKLKGQEKYKIGTYSKGMQQRIGLACALLPDPDLLFLDEPTSALDPVGRKEVREIMLELKERNKTVLLNSHLLSEVEMVCDSVAIIARGAVLKFGSMETVLNSKITLEIHAGNIDIALLDKLGSIDPGLTYRNDRIRMTVADQEQVHEIAVLILETGGRLYALTPHRDTLEEVFINLVKGGENPC